MVATVNTKGTYRTMSRLDGSFFHALELSLNELRLFACSAERPEFRGEANLLPLPVSLTLSYSDSQNTGSSRSIRTDLNLGKH